MRDSKTKKRASYLSLFYWKSVCVSVAPSPFKGSVAWAGKRSNGDALSSTPGLSTNEQFPGGQLLWGLQGQGERQNSPGMVALCLKPIRLLVLQTIRDKKIVLFKPFRVSAFCCLAALNILTCLPV